eukprot:INCI10865.1.p1 GENE.INCI10865.1~~INCI10865.1.p1  ORF type:complete len:197 (+),score=42.89 INCI10865.1:200-790(+)
MSAQKKKPNFFEKIGLALGLLKREVSILVLGLDNSGKSTLLTHLNSKKGDIKEVAPTVGFSVEGFKMGGLKFTCFDMSGQSKYRNLWERYYADVDGIVWVIDSTDKVRMCVVQDEIENMLEHKQLRGKSFPILFFANKMDLPSAYSAVECMEELELDELTRPWHISASNALTGKGVESGVQWLAEQLTKKEGGGGK